MGALDEGKFLDRIGVHICVVYTVGCRDMKRRVFWWSLEYEVRGSAQNAWRGERLKIAAARLTFRPHLNFVLTTYTPSNIVL